MGNRLDEISIHQTVERQTPRNSFGDVMSRVAAGTALVGAELLAPVAAAHPVLTAAVSGIKTLAQGAMTQAKGSENDPMSLVEANRELMYEGAKLNQSYLQLQQEMQRESREFNTLTNVMKARHDSAKAAINNIR
jgi:hypothetical protein